MNETKPSSLGSDLKTAMLVVLTVAALLWLLNSLDHFQPLPALHRLWS